jgi:hypothetical protein
MDKQVERYGDEVQKELSASRRTIRRLLKLFQTEEGPGTPRTFHKVRELYQYQKLSQMIFDVLMRILLDVGNWMTAVGLGLHRGYQAFQSSRNAFREEARYRPPIHIPAAQAKKELERLLASGRIRWDR